MPTWSKSDLDEFEARRLSRDRRPEKGPKPELGAVGNPALVGGPARKESNPPRFHVRVEASLVKPIDPDNIIEKFFIDCIRYSGLIPDDAPDRIALETSQRQVRTEAEEATKITVTRIS